jgi:CCR4-NOT transcription complex subunit 1
VLVVLAQLADAIGDRALQAALLETTYKYIRILLRSDRIRTQSGERSLLKNLGSWLGRLTIARNKPVRHRDLDLKGILYEAYEQGKMIAVLPFVNKVCSAPHPAPAYGGNVIMSGTS